MSDLSMVLATVSQESPCGSNLYDDNLMEAEFSKLANAGMGILAESFVDGQASGQSGPSGLSAWSELKDMVLDTFRQTKHLDMCFYLTLALGRIEGLSGLITGIDSTNAVLSHFWKDVHDSDNSSDYYFRQSSLMKLESAPISDSLGVVVIAQGKQLGTHTFGAWLAATKSGSPELRTIEQAIVETLKDKPEFYDSIATQINELLESLDRLELSTKDHFTTFRLTFKVLRQNCTKLAGLVASYSGISVNGMSDSPSDDSSKDSSSAKSTGSDQVVTREDVVRLLGKIITFYNKNEPTSPVPIMLERAQRVATMNFKEIVNEFNLTGTPSIKEVMGWRDEENNF